MYTKENVMTHPVFEFLIHLFFGKIFVNSYLKKLKHNYNNQHKYKNKLKGVLSFI